MNERVEIKTDLEHSTKINKNESFLLWRLHDQGIAFFLLFSCRPVNSSVSPSVMMYQINLAILLLPD